MPTGAPIYGTWTLNGWRPDPRLKMSAEEQQRRNVEGGYL